MDNPTLMTRAAKINMMAAELHELELQEALSEDMTRLMGLHCEMKTLTDAVDFMIVHSCASGTTSICETINRMNLMIVRKRKEIEAATPENIRAL